MNAVIDSRITKPVVGQPVLVWLPAYQTWSIAFYEADGEFVEWQRGYKRSMPGVRWWMALPPAPKEESC